MLHNPCMLGGCQQRGKNHKGLPHPGLPEGLQEGICYINAAFSGLPNKGDNVKSGYLTPTFSGAQMRAQLLCNPYILGGPQTRGQNQKWCLTRALSRAQMRVEMPHNPCILGGP